ncbi:MAG TPA: SUMF1/EgtB/PvdO family nonheme iron enzyme [Blastocatellia bacterium]|nr:SUMF1/EgtB/PvdO family nonheme iron enzyme [Blastocatellia bacterium]
MSTQPYVFLSYARPDHAKADEVEAFLTAAGLRVFRDRSDISVGDNWDLKIEEALVKCDCCVLLLSAHSMPYRKEVHREWFYFDQKRKPIYPLLLEDCTLHSRFVAVNYQDARTPNALAQLLAALQRAELPIVPPAQLTANNLTDYRRDRIAEWSLTRYRLDQRFVNLTLLLDKGEDQPLRWNADHFRFDDLRNVLANTPNDPALVLLGAPGSGKSTLLRRLQLDHSEDRLQDGTDEISFFLPLNEYHGAQPPREWLLQSWRERFPQLPALDTYLQKGRALLLLDALNEMQPGSGSSYAQLLTAWKEFVQEAARLGNRILFSCRSLDYSASLSSKALRVPQIEVQPMTREQVQGFLRAYAPAQADRLWRELDGSAQFSLFQTPYFLKLLCDQVADKGELPNGRAGLFTGFVRQALAREGDGALFQSGELLTDRDHRKLTQNAWAHDFDLPERGVLIPKLSALAFTMQQNGMQSESAQVRLGYDAACDALAHERAEDIVKAGVALTVLDEDVQRDEVKFFHQLLQEYFAARRLAKEPNPALVQVEWRADKVSEPLAQTLQRLADGDPLPPLPQTGWEETTLTAAPMATDPAAFIRDLIPHNLPLAARCAAAVKVGDALKHELQQQLLARSADDQTDLRARIAAGEALGLLGDPRFALQQGPYGEYLLPPLVSIPGGTYPLGDDAGDYEDEMPAHTVELAPFAIGQFPVTNAEYAKFMAAGGYEDEQWWDTAEAVAWLRGEGSTEGIRQQWRDIRKTLQSDWTEEEIRAQANWTPDDKDLYLEVRSEADEEFEQRLEEWFPEGKQYRQPEFWDDTRFDNPAQPVVGVTWFEARAYCHWLTSNTGRIFRLPTEAEFEAAARGNQGRIFPYGNQFDVRKCNTFESHIRRTTPVGIFANATPEGAFDLSGNAYTWTSSIYDQSRFPYPYRSDDGREDIHQTDVRRVLRGGSWDFNSGFARAASRSYYHPSARNYVYGFRVVRPPL